MGDAGSLQPKGLERGPIKPRLRRVMGMIFLMAVVQKWRVDFNSKFMGYP